MTWASGGSRTYKLQGLFFFGSEPHLGLVLPELRAMYPAHFGLMTNLLDLGLIGIHLPPLH